MGGSLISVLNLVNYCAHYSPELRKNAKIEAASQQTLFWKSH